MTLAENHSRTRHHAVGPIPSIAFSGIDLLPHNGNFGPVETVTLKLNRRHVVLLQEQAKVLGQSRAAVVRDLIDRYLAGPKRPSLYDRAKDLCGSVRGSKGLSSRPLKGYGRI